MCNKNDEWRHPTTTTKNDAKHYDGFFFLIFNNFPSGLNLYYTLFNVLTIAQQKLIPNKPKA